jgi:hypothetical protein
VHAQLKGGFAGIPMHFYGVLNYRHFYLFQVLGQRRPRIDALKL